MASHTRDTTGYTPVRPGDSRRKSWTKTPTASDCRPSKKPPVSGSKSIRLANDLLESAYNVKRTWTGEKDLAEEARTLQREEMENAHTWTQWKHAADKLDILEGNFLYKLDDVSDDCDIQLIRTRLDRLKQANHDGDFKEMLLQIRHSLKRDLGGMCNPHLYQHTHIGTKHLIEEYTEVVKYTIDKIVKHCETAEQEEVDRSLEIMKAAKQSFGNTALMLSGGGTLGMSHIGVIKALLEANILPKVVCGSSAGSIIGSVLCTQRPDAVYARMNDLCNGNLDVFQGPGEWQGVPGMAINLLKGQTAFNVDNLIRVMKELLGEITFREAYNLSGMILNIHVSCRDKHNLPRLLNYVTAPHVLIWSAVATSCAVPGVYEAPGLQAKNPETNKVEHWGHADHKWTDGSIEGDMPAQILERLFNVNNFIAVQVNPHVIQFLPKEGEGSNLLRKGLKMTRSNAIFMLDGLMGRGWDPFVIKMCRAVLSQKYDGDITILPDIAWVPPTQILLNPTRDFLIRATREGEKATWPKLDRIHNSVAIELALDRAVKLIRGMRISKRPRAVSSSRSERGLAWRRSVSSGVLGKLSIGTRFSRGRQVSHRPAQSMHASLRPSLSMTQTPTATEHALSSSDEMRSGGSSPTTEYEEESGCRGDDEDSGDDLENSEDDRLHMLAFLSQPNSPAVSMKSYWGNESLKSPPPSAHASTNMRRALIGLHMSSIDSTVSLPEKKKKSRTH